MEREWFQTLEEFVEWELRANKGSDTRFTKEKIAKMYKEVFPDRSIKSNATKEFLIDEILKVKSLLDIYEELLLHIVYHNYEKVFTGTYANVPYYRAEDYFHYTVEEVEQWKEENIRGYKNRKMKVDKKSEAIKPSPNQII